MPRAKLQTIQHQLKTDRDFIVFGPRNNGELLLAEIGRIKLLAKAVKANGIQTDCYIVTGTVKIDNNDEDICWVYGAFPSAWEWFFKAGVLDLYYEFESVSAGWSDSACFVTKCLRFQETDCKERFAVPEEMQDLASLWAERLLIEDFRQTGRGQEALEMEKDAVRPKAAASTAED